MKVDRQTELKEILSIRDLVCQFESLGDNCEFGLFQRYCGAEPLGFFRFASARSRNLRLALQDRLAGLGDEDDVDFHIQPRSQEYQGQSRRYSDFRYHTKVYTHDQPVETVRSRESKKLIYLKDRLLSDLASGEKVFVRRGDRDPRQIFPLLSLLKSYAPNNILLWVINCDKDHPPGHVEVVKDGLLVGYMSRLAPYRDAHLLDLKCWLLVCTRALQLVRQLRGGPTPSVEMVPNVVLSGGQDLRFFRPGSNGSAKVEMTRDGRSTQVVFKADTDDGEVIARCPVALPGTTRSRTVFSVWVFVPNSFKGTGVALRFLKTPNVFRVPADLSQRDRWQLIWASAQIPKGVPATKLALKVGARTNDLLVLADCQLEEGIFPNARPSPKPPSVQLNAKGRSATTPSTGKPAEKQPAHIG